MKKLSIPERIVLERQLLPGIGKREIRLFLTTALPGLILAFLLFFRLEAPAQKLVSLELGFFYCGCCYGLFAKVEGGLSIYLYLMRIWKYHRSQKNYSFKREKEVLHYVGETRP